MAILGKSIEAMGGEKLLRSIQSVRFTGQQYQNALEQSERYEGPYTPLFGKFEYALDFNQNKLWTSISSTFPKSPTITMVSVIDSGAVGIKRKGNYYPHFYQQPTFKDELDYSIITILLNAKSSTSLTCMKDTVIDGTINKVIQFRKDGYPVKLFINAQTELITATEIQKPYDDSYLSIWGDSKRYTYYSFWELFDNGLHYPLQQDVWMNRKHYQTSFTDNISFNTVQLDSISLPNAVRTQAKNLHAMYLKQFSKVMDGTKEIAKDVWMIPGPGNATVINDGEKIILIEAPHSSTYSAELIKKINSIYPNKKISTVITTSDAWLHVGGLREFAANGCKIIGLKENMPVINDLLASKYVTSPDALERRRKVPAIVEISKNYTLKGNVEIVLVPIRSETGDRMMMIYFPQHKLLYASDLFQNKLPNGKYFVTHYTYEVYQAIEREKLDVQTIYGMHTDMIPYADVKREMELITGK